MTILDILHKIKTGIPSDIVFIFDMDGTLIHTDEANKKAYIEALDQVCGLGSKDIVGRITRDSLKFYNINETDRLNVITYKKSAYSKYLPYTFRLPSVVLLNDVHKTNKVILATQAEKERAEETLRFHNLYDCFDEKFFKGDYDGLDKYTYILNHIETPAEKIYIIEDSDIEIEKAVKAGIPRKNIISILRSHIIWKNEFMRQNNMNAYYHLDYFGYKNQGFTFINTLTCESDYTTAEALKAAVQKLYGILRWDIFTLYQILGKKELVICGVPRSKAISHYRDSELMFNKTIGIVAQHLSEKINVIDGSQYITRHTDTQTTHKRDTIGLPPYPGITKDTCSISDNIKGKDILLIDDIYTHNANIDEDAIQALYDKGANRVTFYSVAWTKYIN